MKFYVTQTDIMGQADFNITFSKVIAEIDRRCNEITHPIPDDIKVIESKIETMRKLVDMMQEALAMYAAICRDKTKGNKK